MGPYSCTGRRFNSPSSRVSIYVITWVAYTWFDQEYSINKRRLSGPTTNAGKLEARLRMKGKDLSQITTNKVI